ncbi:MAG: hypothetical protein HY900_31435 [Deltaproteobacteria bacterium]|nr:hypothetical protein [Deltaproteobacteria bacterium]
MVAFHDLKHLGLQAFLEQNDGEGWMLPQRLRLADYGLGHDERAREFQPVASCLGERLFPWQLDQGVEESWEECERHAALIEKIVPIPALEAAPQRPEPKATMTPVAGKTDLLGKPLPTDLFGNVIYPKTRKR